MNHPLQPLYRLLAGLVAAYIVAFGIVGVLRTGGRSFFAQQGLPSALGLHANRAFAILSIVVGLVLLIGAVIGGNLDQRINLFASGVFFGAGLLMLALLRGSANFLGFTVATCVVSMIIGMVLLLSGLYGKVGTVRDVWAEEDFRHGHGSDPERHRLSAPNMPHDWERDEWSPVARRRERQRAT
ncbi:MAG TPA: DUF4383 domain-containing protein [Micromonosporaceae bacterium]